MAFVHCEVLCYIQNHFAESCRDNMVTALTGCYSEEEIVNAKLLLFDIVDKLPEKPEGLPRHVKRQACDNKKILDSRDILQLYKQLDVAKIQLPCFVAANLSRLPTVKPGEVDVYYMAVTVSNLSKQVEKMAARLAALEKPPSHAEAEPTLHTEVALEMHQQVPPETGSWASVANNNVEDWKQVVEKKPVRALAPVRVKGSRNVGDKLKAVPRRPILAAYVGRLDPDTTEENLSKYLTDEGIKGVVCKKLKAKEGVTWKTAAFYVTCSADSRDLFYDEGCWPDGVELRDWVYFN